MVAVIVEPKTATNFNNISSDTFTCLHSKNRVNGLASTTLFSFLQWWPSHFYFIKTTNNNYVIIIIICEIFICIWLNIICMWLHECLYVINTVDVKQFPHSIPIMIFKVIVLMKNYLSVLLSSKPVSTGSKEASKSNVRISIFSIRTLITSAWTCIKIKLFSRLYSIRKPLISSY